MILRDYTEFAAGFPSQNKQRFFCLNAAFRVSLRSLFVPVAQLEECRFPKPKVAGSIPVGCAKRF